MNDLLNNKLFWVVAVLGVLLIVVGGGSKFFVDKVADRVIHKLQKEYSPSPYGPGLDPDRIDYEKMRQKSPNPPTGPQVAPPPRQVTTPVKTSTTATWEEDWEKQRR